MLGDARWQRQLPQRHTRTKIGHARAANDQDGSKVSWNHQTDATNAPARRKTINNLRRVLEVLRVLPKGAVSDIISDIVSNVVSDVVSDVSILQVLIYLSTS